MRHGEHEVLRASLFCTPRQKLLHILRCRRWTRYAEERTSDRSSSCGWPLFPNRSMFRPCGVSFATSAAWVAPPQATGRSLQLRACCTRWCTTTSRRSASRRPVCTSTVCRDSSRRSSAGSCAAGRWPAGLRASGAKGAGTIGSCRFRVRGAPSVRAAAAAGWLNARRVWSIACFRRYLYGSGS